MAVVDITSKVGCARGTPRIWVEGNKLKRAGIEPNMKWKMAVSASEIQVDFYPHNHPVAVIDKNKDIEKVGSVNSRTKRGDKSIVVPLIEIRFDNILKLFRIDQGVIISIRNKRLIIKPLASDRDATSRRYSLLDKLIKKQPLDMGSAFHGGGVLDKATHSGLSNAGIESKIKLAIELESEYLESSLRNNPELWADDVHLMQGDISDFNLIRGEVPLLDGLVLGIPCVGASIAGATKNKLSCAEEHKSAGALFYSALNLIIATNASFILFECVPEYLRSASMSVIRSVLEKRNYVLLETVINGNEFGSFENRNRMVCIAVTKGMEDFISIEDIIPTMEKPACFGVFMDNVPSDSKSYKTLTYLVEKEKRDIKAGKGFKRQLITAESEKCGVIGKDYAKYRGTECVFVNPDNPDLFRLFTVAEHAYAKTIPIEVVNGCSASIAHQILGQSVIFIVFVATGIALGNCLNKWAESLNNHQQKLAA